MTIGHTFREAKLVQGIVASISLHIYSCAALQGIVSLSALIKGNFTHNLGSELCEHMSNALADVLSRLVRDGLDLLGALLSHGLLNGGKIVQAFRLTIFAFIDKPQRLHFNHDSSMFVKVGAEMVLEDEELLLKLSLSLVAVVLLNGFLPHAHELPLFELAEEIKLLNVIERITLNEPLS